MRTHKKDWRVLALIVSTTGHIAILLFFFVGAFVANINHTNNFSTPTIPSSFKPSLLPEKDQQPEHVDLSALLSVLNTDAGPQTQSASVIFDTERPPDKGDQIIKNTPQSEGELIFQTDKMSEPMTPKPAKCLDEPKKTLEAQLDQLPTTFKIDNILKPKIDLPITKQSSRLQKKAMSKLVKKPEHKEFNPNDRPKDAGDFFSKAQTVLQSFVDDQPQVPSVSTRASNDFMNDNRFYTYRKKVTEQLIKANKIMFSKEGKTLKRMLMTSAVEPINTYVEIGKDGNLTSLQLLKSSGNQMFDEFWLRVIRYAAPFPPIPNHLGIDKFILNGLFES